MAGPMARMMGQGGGPDSRSMDFKVSGKRLISHFKPERLTICVLLLCRVGSGGLKVVGRKILGRATGPRGGGVPPGRGAVGTGRAVGARAGKSSP